MIDIRDYGAKGNGVFNNTEVIQKCIDLCSSQGGTVYIGGKGIYRCGTLYLKSFVRIYIEAGAVLLASPDIRDYGTDTHYNRYRNEKDMDRCWIYAQDQEQIEICGQGEIHGNAEAFPNVGDCYRPMMFRFLRCRNLRLTGLKLLDAAAWTTAFLDSAYIWAEGLEIRNEKQYNGDGLDFDGCTHVFVRDCRISGTDDNLCIQAGSRQYPSEDIHISGCSFTSLCAGIRIGLKSVGDIKNVVITNCTMKNIWREGIKIECTEGGNIVQITVNNITMENVSRPLFLLLNNRYEPQGLGSSIELTEMPEIGTMEHLSFSNILIRDTEEMKQPHYRFRKDLMGAPWFNGIRADAEEKHKIRGLTLENIRYITAGGVKKNQIPSDYPPVVDRKRKPMVKSAENYYPDWSRATYLDMRNVEALSIRNTVFMSLEKDEREAVLIEDCQILRKEIDFIEEKGVSHGNE